MGNKSAYTLLEVLVVLTILGLLIGLVSLQGQKALETKTQTQISADLILLASAAKVYHLDEPADLTPPPETLVAEGYLRELPQAPVAGATYHIAIEPGTGQVRAWLEKEGGLYGKGDFQAEKIL